MFINQTEKLQLDLDPFVLFKTKTTASNLGFWLNIKLSDVNVFQGSSGEGWSQVKLVEIQ